MADGGWIYYSHTEYPHAGGSGNEFAAMDGLKTFLEGMTDWSRHTDIASYGSRLWWWSIEHTGGARVVFAYAGQDPTGTLFASDSEAYNTARNSSDYEDTVWACYVPASFSATALGTDPGTAGFLPTGSTRFFPLTGYVDRSAGSAAHRHQTHVMVRGGNMILAREVDSELSSAIDRFMLLGECILPRHTAHPTEPDTGANAQVAAITMDDIDYSDTFRCQFYNADGSLRSDGQWLYDSSLVEFTVCNAEPWAWNTPTIYVSENDLDTLGVVTGNGIKGIINPEWFRLVCLPGGPMNYKQRLNGGNFVYLRGGIAVGYDPSNGGMT